MPLYMAESESSYSLVPAGLYDAVCITIANLGRQATPYGTLPQLLFSWELVKTADDGGQPFTVSKKVTNTDSSMGNLRKLLDSWRGKPLTDDEAKRFDIETVLGKPCQVLVEHSLPNENGRVYANVTKVLPHKGTDTLKSVAPHVFFTPDSEEPVGPVLAKLPGWVKRLIDKQVAAPTTAGKKQQPAKMPREEAWVSRYFDVDEEPPALLSLAAAEHDVDFDASVYS